MMSRLEYLSKAENCLRSSRACSDLVNRKMLLAAAEQWRKLATVSTPRGREADDLRSRVPEYRARAAEARKTAATIADADMAAALLCEASTWDLMADWEGRACPGKTGRVYDSVVTVCAWSNTVEHDGEWMPFETYLLRRFGLLTSHGMSPKAAEQLMWEEHEGGALTNPKRLAAVRSTGLLDTQPMAGFDRITRLGRAALHVPVTFISLVEEHRDFYLSHCGFGEPLATERQLTGQTFCHFTIQNGCPVIIPDTHADPLYASVPTVESLHVAAYLGVPLVLATGDIIGAFCATDVAPHVWSEEEVLAATDLASLVLSKVELRQADLHFHRQLEIINEAGSAI